MVELDFLGPLLSRGARRTSRRDVFYGRHEVELGKTQRHEEYIAALKAVGVNVVLSKFKRAVSTATRSRDIATSTKKSRPTFGLLCALWLTRKAVYAIACCS
jgi:hypothetical protein